MTLTYDVFYSTSTYVRPNFTEFNVVNQPATVGPDNWTWRLPWPVDQLIRGEQSLAVAAQLREWALRHRR